MSSTKPIIHGFQQNTLNLSVMPMVVGIALVAIGATLFVTGQQSPLNHHFAVLKDYGKLGLSTGAASLFGAATLLTVGFRNHESDQRQKAYIATALLTLIIATGVGLALSGTLGRHFFTTQGLHFKYTCQIMQIGGGIIASLAALATLPTAAIISRQPPRRRSVYYR